MKRKIVVSVLFFVVFLVGKLFSEEGWWNENWEYRISLTLKNPSNITLNNIPVIIPGETIRKKTGLLKEKISANSIRIIDDKGQEIPVQVDEKDETGLFQATGNGELNKDDEIVFQVSLSPNEKKKIFLYFREKLTPVAEYPTDLKFTKTVFGERYINYNAEISNSLISIGIRGSGTEKNAEGKLWYGGLGKASITSFKIKDKQLIHQSHSWAWNLGGGGWTPISNKLPWDNPELLIDGAVRKIVVCKALNQERDFTQEMKNLSWVLSGKVKGDYFRYFALYAHSPYCQMVEAIRIVNADPKYNCLYEFSWAPTHPRDWDNDKLYVPLANQAVTVNFGDGRNYRIKKAEEGWLGIANTKEKRGLAIFFDKDNTTNIFADFYSIGAKRETILAKDWSKTHTHTGVRIWYHYEDFNLLPVRENRFGFYGITEENAEDLRTLYQAIWEGVVTKNIVFGLPEEKPLKK